MSLQIEPATLENSSALTDLANKAYFHGNNAYYRKPLPEGSSFAVHIPRRIDAPEVYTVYCAWLKTAAERKVVGMLYLKFADTGKPGKGELGTFAVDPDCSKDLKVGSQLLERAKQDAKIKGLTHLMLSFVGPIGENNQNRLQAYYVREGFVQTGTSTTKSPTFIGGEVPTIDMELELKD